MARDYDPANTESTAQQTVIGFFRNASDARQAIEALHSHNFDPGQIGAAFREAEIPESSPETGASPAGDIESWFSRLRHTYRGKVTEPARAEWSPDEFESSLARLQIAPERARRLVQDLAPGSAIVTVHAGSRRREAESLLEQNGALIGHEQNPQGAAPPAPTPEAPAASTRFAPPQPSKPGHIQLFGEVLRVHKDRISSGDVRVRKESQTQMETVQVPVTREHLVIEHTDDKGRADGENAIRVPLSEERVRVDKDTVLREEYKVGKRDITQNESITGAVRKERLLIDEAGEGKRE